MERLDLPRATWFSAFALAMLALGVAPLRAASIVDEWSTVKAPPPRH